MASRPLVVEFVGDTASLERAFGRASKMSQDFGNGFDRVGARFNAAGQRMTRTLTPIAGGLALVGRQAFQEWNTGLDTIIAQTGATGAELEGLEASLKRVSGSVTQGIGQVGTVMADVAARTGLAGPPLERLTKQLLDLERLGQNVTVAGLTRLFGDWSIATDEQSAALDKLFRLSQATGAPIETLSQLMVQFGSPLRQLGLDFDTTAAMFARFEREGVNIQSAIPGLRMALKNFAKDGREPAPALLETMKAIKQAKTVAEANTIAFRVFGVRAGPDLAAAIREGRFELDELVAQMKTGRGSLSETAKATLDLSDRFAMFKNRVFASIGPYGEFLTLAAGGLAAIGPTLLGLGQLVPILGKLGALTKVATGAQLLFNAALIANPIGLVIVALVALGVGLVVLWKKSETFRRIVTGAWDAVKRGAQALADFVTEGLPRAFTRAVSFVAGLPRRLAGLHAAFARAGAELGRRLASGILDALKSLPGKLKGALEGALKKGLGKLNPFSPVEHGGKLFIADPLTRGAVEGLRQLGPRVRSALEEALAGAIPQVAVPATASAGAPPWQAGGRLAAPSRTIHIENINVDSDRMLNKLLDALEMKEAYERRQRQLEGGFLRRVARG